MAVIKNWTLEFRDVDRDNFERIRIGEKSIETRAANDTYKTIQVGDTITFVCSSDSFTRTVTKIYSWPSIDAMLKEIPLKYVMPTIETPEQMKEKYASYPGYLERISTNGLLGFEMA